MDHNVIQFIGASCGQHGPYTFYKAFKYRKHGVNRIVTLGEFFFVKLWIDSDLLCIGELQLLWIDKNSEQVLASLRLYFLPENTPEGRMDHGEDEVLAIAEKVVLRVEDLVTWITVDAEWTWGRLGKSCKQIKEPPDAEAQDVGPVSLSESSLDFSDVEKEKQILKHEGDDLVPSVVILSYPKYCRYRAMMKRLEGVESEFLKYNIVKALGGFSFSAENTRVMFCRDTFEYPDLEGHELLCNHLAPKLKGRPRGKRKKRSVSPGSESNESECSVVTSFTAKSKVFSEPGNNKNGYCLDVSAPRRSTRSSDNSESKEFLKKLTSFMKMKRTPLGRTPCLGSKEIDLHDFYTKVQKMGGYDLVTSNRLWKNISDDMSGQQNSSAATVIKRHYERFLLPYERHIRGEEYKPLPVSERRRLKSKSANNSTRSEVENESDRDVPLCSTSNDKSPSPKSTATQNSKETIGNSKQEPKISSLRSVRVKPERQKDKFAKVVKMEEINSDKEVHDMIKLENRPSTEITNEVKEECKEEEKLSVKIENSTIEEKPSTQLEDSSNLEDKESDISNEIKDICKNKNLVIVPCNSTSSDENDQKVPSLEDVKQESSRFIDELRKEKLDILKEGGLEVTPVCSVSNATNNDVKEPLIPPTPVVQLTSKSSRKDTQQISTQGVPVKHLSINVPQSLNISKVTIPSAAKNTAKLVNLYPFPEKTDSTTPPKVVQSKSIYSYSEKTVYGNPKDFLLNSYSVHTPKAPVNLMKPTGGDLLDLTVASPQKPFFDTKIPSIPSTATSSFNFNTSKNVVKAANLPIFEGRKLGSNLEITLVDSKDKIPSTFSRETDTYSRLKNTDYSIYKIPNKQMGMENSNSYKIKKCNENGDYIKPSTSSGNNRSKRGREENNQINHASSTIKRPNMKVESNNTVLKSSAETASTAKYFPQGVQFPHYLSQFYESNKGVNPYFPMIDPLLYSAALQSLYPQASSPLLQFTSQEQLKLYTELMAQQSRAPFPFRLPTDEEFPNNNKK